MKRPLIEIWQEVLAGDPSAWEALVLKYASLVYSVARRSGLSGTDVEDCAQATWLALYRGQKTVRDPLKLPGWLTSTTRRKATRMQQRNQKASEVHKQATLPAGSIQPDDAIIALQRQAQLELAMEQLDPRCRRVLEQIFLAPESMSYKDIALKLGIPPNSLGPTRSRCLRKLRKILSDMDR